MTCAQCKKARRICNGQRPVCEACQKRNLECDNPVSEKFENLLRAPADEQVVLLQREVQIRDQFVQQMRMGSIDVALETFCRLRSSAKNAAILNDGFPPQPAPPLEPPTPSVFALDASVLHRAAYPALQILPPGALEHVLYRIPFENQFELRLVRAGRQPLVRGPPRPGQYYNDFHLRYLKISQWTNVKISNEVAAVLISFYLETKHSILPFFDATEFLNGLVHDQGRSCTRFLVNAILYAACQTYAIVDEQTSKYAPRFFNEARILFAEHQHVCTITSVGAMQIFSMGCHTDGRDDFAQLALRTGRHMAERLRLFGMDSYNFIAPGSTAPYSRTEYAQVAWSTYVWISCHAIHFRDDPILRPPMLPCIHVEQKLFEITCGIWKVAQEVFAAYLPPPNSVDSRLTMEFADEQYKKLLALADKLFPDLKNNTYGPAAVSMFMSSFHSVVLHTFRPFVQGPDFYVTRLMCMPSYYAEGIFKASVQQLKQMVYDWAYCYDGLSHNVFVTNAVLLLAQVALKGNHGDAESQNYLMLSLQLMERLYLGLPAMLQIARAFLAMAMERGLFSCGEARSLLCRFHRQDNGSSSKSALTIIVDQDLALCHVPSARCDVIAPKYEQLAALDDICIGDFVGWNFTSKNAAATGPQNPPTRFN